MKCKIIVNRDSGNCDKLNTEALLDKIGRDSVVEIIDASSDWNADNFDTVVVCGGDGTLCNALDKCRGKRLVYCPCGTFNETAHTEKRLSSVCRVNDIPFSYVCAAGSFTEIGYTTKTSDKQRLKIFAYLKQAIRSYRCHEICATIDVDERLFCGTYTLLMVLKSHRCFGLPFNRDFKRTGKTYLLAIKSFGDNTLLNKIRMFFPFFRVFFCGTNPKVTKNWLILPFDNLSIRLESPQYFCVDGEKRLLGNTLRFSTAEANPPIEILKPPLLRKKRKPVLTVKAKTVK